MCSGTDLADCVAHALCAALVADGIAVGRQYFELSFAPAHGARPGVQPAIAVVRAVAGRQFAVDVAGSGGVESGRVGSNRHRITIDCKPLHEQGQRTYGASHSLGRCVCTGSGHQVVAGRIVCHGSGLVCAEQSESAYRSAIVDGPVCWLIELAVLELAGLNGRLVGQVESISEL